MKLNFRKPGVSVPQRLHPQKWSNSSNISTANQEWQASAWVKLQEPPSPYSHDEALLLCQHSETEWVVWIPEHGEMVLHRSQFDQVCSPNPDALFAQGINHARMPLAIFFERGLGESKPDKS